MSGWFQLLGYDLLAAIWLVGCWSGYAKFAQWRARRTFSISSVLHHYRSQWMASMLRRENRVADASLLSSLERNASFLASTAMLIIAGLVTALASTESVHAALQTVPVSRHAQTPIQLQFKIMVLLLVYIYTFFTFTWSMRQYGFCAIMLGAAPLMAASDPKAAQFSRHASSVIDQAGLSYNYGLRAYYFSLSVLVWMFSLWLFFVAVALVVAVLYGREFHSDTLKSMIAAADLKQTEDE
nr:DUF599 domain-containing protein [Saccharophagus sp. K07]